MREHRAALLTVEEIIDQYVCKRHMTQIHGISDAASALFTIQDDDAIFVNGLISVINFISGKIAFDDIS